MFHTLPLLVVYLVIVTVSLSGYKQVLLYTFPVDFYWYIVGGGAAIYCTRHYTTVFIVLNYKNSHCSRAKVDISTTDG